jgi:hypothetical protein
MEWKKETLPVNFCEACRNDAGGTVGADVAPGAPASPGAPAVNWGASRGRGPGEEKGDVQSRRRSCLPAGKTRCRQPTVGADVAPGALAAPGVPAANWGASRGEGAGSRLAAGRTRHR